MANVIPNQQTEREWTPFDATMVAEGVEEVSVDETIEAWAYLIATGQVWTLQGFFGRNAQNLIEQGIIEQDGTIDWDLLELSY
tara:strand:+ start:273 stop:521 length:249 start_codon:yes stop_codon:yes gene_type:complete